MFEYFTSRFSLQELSGSLGDLGTFLPIIVGMSAKNVINIGSAFFWTGLFNIITGYLWDAPICVQPMKTIASASIAGNLDSYSVVTSGFLRNYCIRTRNNKYDTNCCKLHSFLSYKCDSAWSGTYFHYSGNKNDC